MARFAGVGLLSVGAVLRDWDVIECRLPESRRQIPKSVFDDGLLRGSAFFGFQLGAGVFTYLCATTPYLLAAAIVLVPARLSEAIVAGAAFGLARGGLPLLRAASRAGSDWDVALQRRHSLLVRARQPLGRSQRS